MEQLPTNVPRVLVVEDEGIVAAELKQRLSDLGFAVMDPCLDSTSALEVLERERPDIVIMDIAIPGRTDGISTAAMIRDLYQIPVVFMTGLGDPSTLKRAATADPYGYLLKPCSDEELRVTIDLSLFRHGNRFPPTRMKENSYVPNGRPDKEEVLRFLSSLEIFQEVRFPDLKELASVSRMINLSSGERLSSEDDSEAPTFLVVQGRLALLKSSYEGKELTVDLIGPRDVFGIVGAIDQMPAAVTIRAQIPTTIVAIGRSRLSLLLEKYPELYKAVLQQLSHRLRTLQSSACALAHERVEVRIAQALCHFWTMTCGDTVPAGQVTLHATRQEIADLAGTTLESAVRTMRSMASRGILQLGKKRHVGIADLQALQNIASGPSSQAEAA